MYGAGHQIFSGGRRVATKGIKKSFWMAPELFVGPEVDLHSYGLIMWEVLHRREPWPWDELGDDSIDYLDLFRGAPDCNRVGPTADDRPLTRDAAPGVRRANEAVLGGEADRPTFKTVTAQLHDPHVWSVLLSSAVVGFDTARNASVRQECSSTADSPRTIYNDGNDDVMSH